MVEEVGRVENTRNDSARVEEHPSRCSSNLQRSPSNFLHFPFFLFNYSFSSFEPRGAFPISSWLILVSFSSFCVSGQEAVTGFSRRRSSRRRWPDGASFEAPLAPENVRVMRVPEPELLVPHSHLEMLHRANIKPMHREPTQTEKGN